MTVQTNLVTQQIGAPVPGLEGAIYAGVAPAEGDMPQAHLVLELNMPKTRQDVAASMALAKNVRPGMDSHLPSLTESSLLYATLRDRMDQNSLYWTSSHHGTDDSKSFFAQRFDDGYQFKQAPAAHYLALAVTRLPISG